MPDCGLAQELIREAKQKPNGTEGKWIPGRGLMTKKKVADRQDARDRKG